MVLILQLNLGVYRKFLNKETISKMKEIAALNLSSDDMNEPDYMSEVQKFVTDQISHIRNNL